MSTTKRRVQPSSSRPTDTGPEVENGGTGGWRMPDELPAVLTVEEAARVLRIGRNAAYAAVAAGTIRSIRMGRTIRISRRELERLLDSTVVGREDNERGIRAG